MNKTIADSTDFGNALRTRRKQLGYTQAYLAEFTGFSVSFISDLENGKPTAELGKALHLANLLALNCTLTPRGKS
ncbi:MAG: helix-turn-helix transcriptional regulator [Treponema sp.]|nr:helix-turn-helix transcriptional regulator [Treponema sp.]